MRVAGVPFDAGDNAAGSLTPTACVLHRTYGSWPGDYQVGKHGRSDSPGIGFHFLVGKNEGQWAQFYDTRTKTGHAKGANSWAFGIEITGTNADVLTDWQVRALAHILGETLPFHGIPCTFYNGPRKQVAGCLNHASVPGSDHTDLITRADWDRIVAAMNGTTPAPQPTPGDDMTPEQWQFLQAMNGKLDGLGQSVGSVATAVGANWGALADVVATAVVSKLGTPVSGQGAPLDVAVIAKAVADELQRRLTA